MTKHYVHVISECGIGGVLQPRIVFMDNQRIDVERIFHTFTMTLDEAEGPALNSYRCLMQGKFVNVMFEGKTNKWFLSEYGKNLYH